MEAMAWRLDQKRCGGGVEVMGLFMGFKRLGRIWVAFGWLDLGPLVVIFSDRLGDLF